MISVSFLSFLTRLLILYTKENQTIIRTPKLNDIWKLLFYNEQQQNHAYLDNFDFGPNLPQIAISSEF